MTVDAERPAVFLEHTRTGIRALGKRHRRTRLGSS
jgi:hypothetical protein